ncbi:hypothetical protein ACERIT_01755 [Halopenitus sp. H-Gu1]|uniref:hypothetical protein n=1 Tax=Halopenitus sp. H-Gu1 TaxID=3242697 RepID=UPI00359D166C
MITRLYRILRTGLTQLTIAFGIAVFPFALAAHRAGIPFSIPVRRLVEVAGATE